MAVNPLAELVWQGRIHLGDEPGVYGDAAYAGLMMSIAFTAFETLGGGQTPVAVSFETEDCRTFPPYPGHEVALVRHYPDPANPQVWREQTLATVYLTSASNNVATFHNVTLAGFGNTIYLSVRIRVDTTVPAGLYDDFVARRLKFDASPSHDYFAALGFDI